MCYLCISPFLSLLTLAVVGCRIPVWLVWPVAAMAVIAQTVATSALLSVPLTLVLSPMISLVQVQN